jgi:hypothetical protein
LFLFSSGVFLHHHYRSHSRTMCNLNGWNYSIYELYLYIFSQQLLQLHEPIYEVLFSL